MMDKPGTFVPQSTGLKVCSIFNIKEYGKIIDSNNGIKISKLMKLNLESSNVDSTTSEKHITRVSTGGGLYDEAGASNALQTNIAEVRSCSFCNVTFSGQIEQRQHYKLDWHRYNIKLNIKQKQYVSETRFSEIMDSVNVNDDVSSISGSESETGEDERNLEGDINEQKTETDSNLTTESQYVEIVNNLPSTLIETKWFILMLGGGHFAAAIFHGAEPILHKTFHSYTVRAKQGGSQSVKDNKRATNAKSAGASLRRYNEQAQVQHVQEILSCWAKELADCELLFYRALGPANRSILFSGKQPPLQKSDARLFSIPFPTRRATYNEVKRVHSLLSSAYVYESKEVFSNLFQLHSQPGGATHSDQIKKKKTNRANQSKQRQPPTRKANQENLEDLLNHLIVESTSTSEEEDEYENVISEEIVSFSETLQEYDNTLLSHKSATGNCAEESVSVKKRKKKEKERKSEQLKPGGKFAKQIYLGCIEGNIEILKSTLTIYKEDKTRRCHDLSENQEHQSQTPGICLEESNDSNVVDDEINCVFNQRTQDGLTLLQNAAKNSQIEIVRFLLENGADPCARDKKAMTAYDFAPDKETRNAFRRFMDAFPDKYDYSKSHIPSPLNDEIAKEISDKKRALKKAKRQNEKERKRADIPRREEEAEKERYLKLSDREKMALAAERRILKSSGEAAKTLVLLRCYKCAINITGKVPFEYNKFQFCSIDCLISHRKASAHVI